MVELKGPAVIQGVGSAVPITENSFDNPVWKTYDGRLLAVIRAGYEAGSIKVILSSKGCREQEVFLEIKEQD